LLLVSEQFPIHYELMCQKLASLYGKEKASSTVRKNIDIGLRNLSDKVIRKGYFIFPSEYSEITVRIPNDRKISHISIEELAAAMFRIVSHCVGINRESLCVETARLYGFNRSGQNITAAMYDAYDLLLSQGKAKEIGGKLSINN